MITTDLPFITKILIPKRREGIIRRTKPLDIVKSGLDRRVQILWAPAGYGKTTLLVDFISDSDFPVCWYSFTPEDNEPLEFLRYCVRTLESRFKDGNKGDVNWLIRTSTADWRTLVGLLVTAFHNKVEGKLLFIFDDVHHIDTKSALKEALSLLIERSPSNVHFLIASRTKPSISCLPKLVAQDDVSWLDNETLRLSVEEIAEALSSVWERSVPTEEAQEVATRTGGWVTGVLLTARTRSRDALSPTLASLNESVFFDYLTQEVFNGLPERLKSFLLQTSILKEFSVRLCDNLLNLAHSSQLIHEIKERGLFLEERGSEDSVYRYHDLFREYLERKFSSEKPESYKAFNQRAGSLFQQVGNHDAAIRHLTKAGEAEGAAQIIRQVADRYLQERKWQTLTAWLDLLPRELSERDPHILMVRGAVLLRSGDPARAMEEFDKATAIAEGNDWATAGRVLVHKASASRALGRLDAAVKIAEQGIAVLRSHNARAEDLSEAYRQLASALAGLGEFQRAKEYFELASNIAPQQNLPLISTINDGLAAVHIETGELNKASMYLEKARQGWLKLENNTALPLTLNNLANVYYYLGDFDIALDEITEALKVARAVGERWTQAFVLITRGIMQRANGLHHDALTSLLEGLEMARSILDQRLIAEAVNGLGNTYRDLGELSKAEALLQQAIPDAEQSGERYICARYHLSLGKVYCQMGSFEEATEHLGDAKAMFGEVGSQRGLAEAKLHQGLVFYKLTQVREALVCLRELDHITQRLGYEGFLLADGAQVSELVQFGAAKGAGGVFTRLARRMSERAQLTEPDRTTSPAQRSLPPLKVFSFGQASVFLGKHEVTDSEWRSRKAKELFYFLLCTKRVVTKEEIIEALWPDVTLENFAAASKMNIYRLRQALYPGCVLSKGDGYCFNPESPVDFDLEVFEESLRTAERCEEESPVKEENLLRAMEMYIGPFLNEFYSDWCQSLRTSLEIKYIRALMNVAKYYTARGELGRSVEVLEKLVESDPYNEEANYLLAETCLKLGDRFGSLKYLERYIKAARTELGISVPAHFLSLYNQALTKAPPA
ncbi:MAG: tetratricopeptide repeat protein [Candidatus Aenigmarchaeota archaeon]|nr:tetratricopeptide repeat protein [Candidatus Aenigmarchaeota archaeon]